MMNKTDSTGQTKETIRKAERIRKLRDGGITWAEICRRLKILKENGDPDTGLAYRIAYEEYEPKSPELRDRLGLRRMCLTCMRGIRKSISTAASLSPWRLWWKRLDPEDRDRRIREHYERDNNK